MAVVQPDSISSAIAVLVETVIISGDSPAQIGNSAVSQSNSSPSCAAGTTRVRL